MTTTDTRMWAQMNGSGFPRFSLPPADVLPPPVAKAARRYDELVAGWREAAAEVREIDTKPARKAAEQADVDAYGAAIAAGKPDPGETHLHQYEEKVRAAVRRKAAAAKAADLAAKELRAAVDAHRDAIDKKAGERLAKAEAAWLAHIDALPVVGLELAEARRLAAWPHDLERHQKWGRPLPLPDVAGLDAKSLARLLHAVVAPPEPEPAAPLHVTNDMVGGPRSKAAA